MDKLDLLIKSLDGELEPEERAQLDRALAASEALRGERNRLLAIRAAFGKLQPETDASFADRVMTRIQLREESMTAIIARLYPRVAAASIAVILIVLLVVYFTEGSLTPDTFIGIENLTVDDAYSLVVPE
jgi:anti-sigma factor RsiW